MAQLAPFYVFQISSQEMQGTDIRRDIDEQKGNEDQHYQHGAARARAGA